jgi:alpha/beta superfamily hydrolase
VTKQHKLRIKGPVGAIETVIEEPVGVFANAPVGLALIAHPHPLKGGSLDNKVAWTLARAAVACGLVAVRPNFRGVGSSAGEYDHGIGETEDLLALAAAITAHYGKLPWTLMGFSFGAYVQHRVAQELHAERLIMVGPAVSMYAFEAARIPTTILHGIEDEVIPFQAAREYADLHAIPLIAIEGAGHFFHGKLRALQSQVEALCKP